MRAHHTSKNGECVDVWLHNMAFERPRRAIITAGCGGGLTFDDLSGVYEPLASGAGRATPQQLATMMKQLHLGAELYQSARGVHTAVLAEPDPSGGGRVLLCRSKTSAATIASTNCKAALLAGISTQDRILLSSGRISSEMINKARRLETPIVCSRTSPTSLSVAWQRPGISRLWPMRQDRMRVYTHERDNQ